MEIFTIEINKIKESFEFGRNASLAGETF